VPIAVSQLTCGWLGSSVQKDTGKFALKCHCYHWVLSYSEEDFDCEYLRNNSHTLSFIANFPQRASEKNENLL